MVVITFLPEEQGESIVLEWVEGSRKKIGVVDCCLNYGQLPECKVSNKVVEYINKNSYRQIEFLLITHPLEHRISGVPHLLSICKDQNIRIRKVVQAYFPDPLFFKKDGWSLTQKKRITNLIKDVNRLKEIVPPVIEVEKFIDPRYRTISIGGNVYLSILSPAEENIDSFDRLNRDKSKSDQDKVKKYKSKNYLAVFCIIHNGREGILLTSDCDPDLLANFPDAYPQYSHIKIKAVQLPKKSSLKLLNEKFWKTLNKSSSFEVILPSISHSDIRLLRFFKRNKISIRIPNKRAGSIHISNSFGKLISSTLDLISKPLISKDSRVSIKLQLVPSSMD